MFDVGCSIISVYFSVASVAVEHFSPLDHPVSPSSDRKTRVGILQWKTDSTLLAR